MSRLLLGSPVAEKMYEEISNRLAEEGKDVKLATVGFSNPQWMQYVTSLEKSAAKCNIAVKSVFAENDATPETFAELVRTACEQIDVCGVIVQQPLPVGFENAVNSISDQKDLDCLSPNNVAKLYKGKLGIRPATPLAVLKLLDYYNVELQGKHVVIVGRGNAVGKPLALMCLQRNATVTVCHTKTRCLAEICRTADVLISACGSAGLITKDHVTENTVVVDVGLSFVNGKTCGDVADEVKDLVAAISPVPGGVGPVTRATLFYNLLGIVFGEI